MGFIRTQVNVSENDPQKDVCFRVTQGSLEILVSVQVTARDRTATCEFTSGVAQSPCTHISVYLSKVSHQIQSNCGQSCTSTNFFAAENTFSTIIYMADSFL